MENSYSPYPYLPSTRPISSHKATQKVVVPSAPRYKKPILLKTNEAADFLGLVEGTLVVWRCTKRQKIPYIKVGGRVRYMEKDLLAWLEAQRVEPEGWKDV